MLNREKAVATLDSLVLDNATITGWTKAKQNIINPIDTRSIQAPASFANEVKDYFSSGGVMQGKTLPWQKTHEDIRIRPGEVTCWHGYNGHGKTQVLGQVIVDLAKQSEICCIASLEMHPRMTLARMARQVTGTAQPTPVAVDEFLNWGQQKLWLYNQQGTVNGNRVLDVFRYCTEVLGVTQFVIDSLMKCGISKSESHATYTSQMHFIDSLCAAAKDTNAHIHLVAHDKKPEDENIKPHKYMISGSSDISNMVDNCIGVWRNKKKEHNAEEMADHPCTVLVCDKQRNGDFEGNISLYFDKPSYRYKEVQHEKVWEMKLG